MRKLFPVITVLGFLISICLTACGPEFQYRSGHRFGEEYWEHGDSLVHQFNISDSLQIYDLYLLIEHAKSYPYQNLYTRIHTIFPDKKPLTEVLSLEFAEKTGQWLGQCGTKYCTIRIPIQQGAYFNQVGDYELILEQFTRQDSLPGVRQIIFELEKTENRREAANTDS